MLQNKALLRRGASILLLCTFIAPKIKVDWDEDKTNSILKIVLLAKNTFGN